MQLTNQQPLISCLCVTNDRVSFLKRSIRCFNAQDYNNKELVIVHKKSDYNTRDFLRTITQANILSKEIEPTETMKLGDIRNQAIAFSNGAYFCNWDDDDWYASTRLTRQMETLLNNGQSVSLLTNILVYDKLTNDAYFSMFRLWETSILCEKKEIKDRVKYGSLQRAEDAFLVNQLLDKSKIFPTAIPNLMIYVIHGTNTMNRSHYDKLFKQSQKLPVTKAQLLKDILEEKVSIQEGTTLLQSKDFLQELNYFYKKAGYITIAGLTVYGKTKKVA